MRAVGKPKAPKAIALTVQQAFHDADNVMRAQPAEYHDELVDAVLSWALRSYLPSSSWFQGLFAYAIDPSQRDDPENPVIMIHARTADDIERAATEFEP